jgi:heme-degrading monooxygenase HmoA
MYGTIARLHAKPGTQDQILDLGSQDAARRVPGFVTQYVYRSGADPDEYWPVVDFESREAYVANAASPAQDANYRRLRELLTDDPEWHDGEIVTAFVAI